MKIIDNTKTGIFHFSDIKEGEIFKFIDPTTKKERLLLKVKESQGIWQALTIHHQYNAVMLKDENMYGSSIYVLFVPSEEVIPINTITVE